VRGRYPRLFAKGIKEEQCPPVSFTHFAGYLNVGITIPRRMMFWQKIKTTRVGMEATTRDAMTRGTEYICWNWYKKTVNVHIDGSWQVRNANMKDP